VEAVLLDGSVAPAQRGKLAAAFKRHEFAVLIAGLASMSRGHSFENCAHLILPSYSWAFDENDQFLHRIWRLNSPRPVTIYPMVTSNTIEERILAGYSDKSDSSQLALDGRLFADTVEQLDPERLLAESFDAFKRGGNYQDESALELAWPGLSKRLRWSQIRFREWHPPVLSPVVTAADLAAARSALATHNPALDFAIARERAKQSLSNRKHRP